MNLCLYTVQHIGPLIVFEHILSPSRAKVSGGLRRFNDERKAFFQLIDVRVDEPRSGPFAMPGDNVGPAIGNYQCAC